MFNLITFILACYGLTSILLYGKIFDKIRPKSQLFHCSQCLGFWVGILINILFYYLNCDIFASLVFGGFLSGCISSGTTYVLDKIVSDDGIQIKNK